MGYDVWCCNQPDWKLRETNSNGIDYDNPEVEPVEAHARGFGVFGCGGIVYDPSDGQVVHFEG